MVLLVNVAGVFLNRCQQLNDINLNPCRCEYKNSTEETNIYCDGENEYDLKAKFSYLSETLPDDQKDLNGFYLWNGGIKELPENVFHDITFREIIFSGANNLTHIHSQAFTATSLTVTTFMNHMDNRLVNKMPEYNFYSAISSLVNLQMLILNLDSRNVHEMPWFSFRPLNGIASNLASIYFYGYDKIILGNYAFYEFPNLNMIYLREHQIDYVPIHAFEFRQSSQTPLTIQLAKNNLNGSSFEVNSLLNTKRPVYLELSLNFKLSYLDEAVFLPFFKAHKRNQISLFGSLLDCDCRNLWLIEQNSLYQLENRINGAQCKDGTPLFSLTVNDFVYCSSNIDVYSDSID